MDADAGRFTPRSRIRDVLVARGEAGRQLLYGHGYNSGEGFTDSLSQYQSLEMAQRTGQIRDLDGLLDALNAAT